MTNSPYLEISVDEQRLRHWSNQQLMAEYPISTAKNGTGQQMGSGCTPLGKHRIRAKIGEGLPINSVFVGRRATGEIYTPELAQQYPQRDWILSRILWLGGLEAGKNRYGEVDTTWRYIYIHGCPDEIFTGSPQSHGCIRMNNADMLLLFNQVTIGLKIFID